MAKSDHQKNSPEVEHRLDVVGKDDAQAQHRDDLVAALEDEKAQLDERHDRAMALAAPIQRVTDGNETAAIASITGQVPVRDMTGAPPPAPLGTQAADAVEVAEEAGTAPAKDEPKTAAKVS